MLLSDKGWAETAGWASGSHQTPCRRGHSPQVPHPGQRSGFRGWSYTGVDQHKAQKTLLGRGGGRGGGACPGLSCFCLASIVTSPPGLVCLAGRGPPGLPFTWRGHLLHLHSLAETFQLSSYIPFTKKKNLDLKTCEHIIRKKVSWKNVVRMSKGLGHRKWLRPPPSPHPHTCQLGSLSISCVGFQAQGCRSAEGLGALRHRSKEIQRKRLITNHAILFSRPGAGCCWAGCPLCEPTRLYPTSHVPPTGLRPPTGAFFVTHFLSHNGIA